MTATSSASRASGKSAKDQNRVAALPCGGELRPSALRSASDLKLVRQFEHVVDLDAEAPHDALQLPVAKQKLASSIHRPGYVHARRTAVASSRPLKR